MSARPEHCVTCGWRMRGNRYTAQQVPGTRVYSGKGQCTYCRRKERRPEAQAPDYDLAHTIYGLNSWLANLPSRKQKA